MKTRKEKPSQFHKKAMKLVKEAKKYLKSSKHKDLMDSLASTDITFCSNAECPLRKNCHRSLDNLKTNPGRHLSVSHFEVIDGKCQWFWDRRK